MRNCQIKFIEFCFGNQLKIGILYFKTKEIHKKTRQVLSRDKNSITDYFFTDNELWNKIKNRRVRRGLEIGSDHFLLDMAMKLEERNNHESKKH